MEEVAEEVAALEAEADDTKDAPATVAEEEDEEDRKRAAALARLSGASLASTAA